MADDLFASTRPELVLGVGPSGLLLANLTPRSPVRRVLDLGTGCGLQALLASRHAEQVFATDINRRALSTTSLNAERNGIGNVQTLLGDLFDPVEGMRFDLILCNPPYVISPDVTYTYRDGGRQGGGILQRIFRRVPEFLVEGGMAVINAQWQIYAGDRWSSEPARWTEGRGLDLWMICHGFARPEEYARAWLEHGAENGPIEPVSERWTRWYASEKIQALATGTLILRRRSGDNWRRAIRAPRNPGGECGPQIERIFKAQDDLQEEFDSGTFFQSRFRLAPETRILSNVEHANATTLVGADPDIGWNHAVDGMIHQALARIKDRGGVDRIIDLMPEYRRSAEKHATSKLVETLVQLYGGGFLIRSD